MQRGKLMVLEGIDNSGKSSVARGVAEELENAIVSFFNKTTLFK